MKREEKEVGVEETRRRERGSVSWREESRLLTRDGIKKSEVERREMRIDGT